MRWPELPPRQRIYPITRALWLGPFASPERRPILIQAGITDILNVSDAPNVLAMENGDFQSVAWHPLEDLTQIDSGWLIECLTVLHHAVIKPDSQVYVHCIAGQNRSATILWLYLVASGLAPDQAKQMIVAASYDAVPGHSGLSNVETLQVVTDFGRERFQPHPRPTALLPAD